MVPAWRERGVKLNGKKKRHVIHQVGDTIPVLVRFRDGQFEPLRFKWSGRTRLVDRVTGRWAEHDGQYRIYHFAIISDTESCYELSFHVRRMEWVLDRVLAGDTT